MNLFPDPLTTLYKNHNFVKKIIVDTLQLHKKLIIADEVFIQFFKFGFSLASQVSSHIDRIVGFKKHNCLNREPNFTFYGNLANSPGNGPRTKCNPRLFSAIVDKPLEAIQTELQCKR